LALLMTACRSHASRAFARRFGARTDDPHIISADAAAAEWGEWARGYARDQRLSGAKAQRELGWQPRHLDPEGEVAASVEVRNKKARGRELV
jgi:hypothetical protein